MKMGSPIAPPSPGLDRRRRSSSTPATERSSRERRAPPLRPPPSPARGFHNVLKKLNFGTGSICLIKLQFNFSMPGCRHSTDSVAGSSAPRQERAVPTSKYEEDVCRNNHTSVWGSYWEAGKWGYHPGGGHRDPPWGPCC